MSTRVELRWRSHLDLELIEQGVEFWWRRVIASVALLRPDREREEAEAIVDCGSPISVAPQHVWRGLESEWLPAVPVALGGFGGDRGTRGRLGRICLQVIDDRGVSPVLPVRAVLLSDDSQPLILGVDGVLNRAALHCHAGRDEAYLEFEESA